MCTASRVFCYFKKCLIEYFQVQVRVRSGEGQVKVRLRPQCSVQGHELPFKASHSLFYKYVRTPREKMSVSFITLLIQLS